MQRDASYCALSADSDVRTDPNAVGALACVGRANGAPMWWSLTRPVRLLPIGLGISIAQLSRLGAVAMAVASCVLILSEACSPFVSLARLHDRVRRHGLLG